MHPTTWKKKENRICRTWFGVNRTGSTGRCCADGNTDKEAIEVFTYGIPKKLLEELAQAEKDAGNDKIPWAVFGPRGGKDEDMIIFTKLKYFPKVKQE